MNKFVSFLIFVSISIFSFSQEIAIPELERRVTDLTNTLSDTEIDYIEKMIIDMENKTGSQLAVLMIPTTGDETIEQFSFRVAVKWQIGSEEFDDGVILVIAKDDRELRIEVGYGLESVITDANASIIINNYIVPEFKNGNFYFGVYYGVYYIIDLINGGTLYVPDEYVSEEVAEEETFAERHFGWVFTLIMLGILLPIVFFFTMRLKAIYTILIFLGIVGLNLLMGKMLGGILHSIGFLINTAMFGLPMIIIRICTKGDYSKMAGGGGSYSSSSYNNSSYNSSSYSSSSYSSSSSSSSSYSGGGGSFGGGGASGKW